MKKPNPTAILRAVPLTAAPQRGPDPILVCNICGRPSAQLDAWREHDERDQPIAGPGALVFIDNTHQACKRALDKHPRLYAEDRGLPGTFPGLCGSCTNRRGVGCAHPNLRANGGPGLNVSLSNGLPAGTILCGRGGRIIPLRKAFACEGRSLPGEVRP